MPAFHIEKSDSLVRFQNMIQKHFTPTVTLFFKASREIFHSNKTSYLFYGFFVGVPIFLLLLGIASGKNLSHAVVAGIPAWGMVFISVFYAIGLIPALQYWNIRKSVLSNRTANQSQNYDLDENGIRNYGAGVDVAIDWGKVIRIRKSRNFLLFYISRNMAYFIPLNLLSITEIEQIHKWYKEKT
jgi:hypothetical protein